MKSDRKKAIIMLRPVAEACAVAYPDLADILAKNQNQETGDGSFNEHQWLALRDALEGIRDMTVWFRQLKADEMGDLPF